MSGLIELFWRPQPKDVPSGLIAQGRYFETVLLTPAAAATLSAASQPCPPNTLRVVTHLAMRSSPGAAQTVTRSTASWLLGGSQLSIMFRLARNPPIGTVAAAIVDDYIALGDGIWLRPSDTIQYTVVFNAGVAVNDGQLYLFGYEFPVGNTL